MSAPLFQDPAELTNQVYSFELNFTLLISRSPERNRFTGKPYSIATGLYYYYQRWYDPSIGRFISQDPLAGGSSNPQSLNPYVYVQDSPATYTDPSGMVMVTLRHGSSCPSMWDGAFWKDPLGSLECGFGFGPAAAITGGGVGESGGVGPGTGAIEPSPAGAIVVGIMWGAWGAYELYSHWGEWFGARELDRPYPMVPKEMGERQVQD
ncbi:MAG TPA: RHS repeat-associated core domain-containing protein [Candidatus Bathyarchaeia archaeon]|nr:RHS repeat-associated core domain-containing protein [Candidatus Bathyarchaeia archaeon]